MSAHVYPVTRYFLGEAAHLDVGIALPLLQIDMLRLCAPARLTMREIIARIVQHGIASADQAHAMTRTLYLSLRSSRMGRLMDDTFLDPNSKPMQYFVTPLGHDYLHEQERSAA